MSLPLVLLWIIPLHFWEQLLFGFHLKTRLSWTRTEQDVLFCSGDSFSLLHY